MCCRCGDVLCATLYDGNRLWKVCDVCWRLEVVLYALETLEGVHRVLLFMLEAVAGELCLLKVLELTEVMRRVLLCTLEAVRIEFCLLEVLEVLR